MKRRSRLGQTTRKSAKNLSRTTERDLERLRAAMTRPVDASAIAEGRAGPPRSHLSDRRTKPTSPIRDAILKELGRRGMTRYELWKRGRAYCPTLPESAVYEFLRGDRQIGLAYVEALMAAVDLVVKSRGKKRLRKIA